MPRSDAFAEQIVNMWKTETSFDYAYFDKVESMTDAFWKPGSVFREQFEELNLDTILEIACGKGRHTAQIASRCRLIYAADTSVDALAELAIRFNDQPNVRPILVTGQSSLPDIADETVTAVFSYDAMVHFEMLTMAGYFQEIARVLRSDGRVLLHHSNFGANPEGKFTDNPGWRNFMTTDIVRYLASRNGLEVVSQRVFDWAAPGSDALTQMRKP